MILTVTIVLIIISLLAHIVHRNMSADVDNRKLGSGTKKQAAAKETKDPCEWVKLLRKT